MRGHDGRMTRFAIDAPVALRLIREEIDVPAARSLVAPSVLRSHALSLLYRDVRNGVLDESGGRRQLDELAGLKIRLLGDRVSRATAWRLADELGWDDTPAAEYLAVAVLQADALVSDDPVLMAAASARLRVAPFSELVEP